MATYYSPLYSGNFPLNTVKGENDRLIARVMRGSGKRAALMKALNGVVPGSLATDTRKRIAAGYEGVGGIKPIETFTVLSRNTTAGDVTFINKLLAPTSRIATPTNLAGKWPA